MNACGNDASFVSIETEASPVCEDHLKLAKRLWSATEFVTVKEWTEKICPEGEHPPHVGCWDWFLDGKRVKMG